MEMRNKMPKRCVKCNDKLETRTYTVGYDLKIRRKLVQDVFYYCDNEDCDNIGVLVVVYTRVKAKKKKTNGKL